MVANSGAHRFTGGSRRNAQPGFRRVRRSSSHATHDYAKPLKRRDDPCAEKGVFGQEKISVSSLVAVVSLEVPSRKGRYLWRIITCLWWGRHVVGDRVAENGPFAVARAGVDYSARSLPPASLTDTVSSLSLLLTLLLSPFLTMATRAGYNKNSSAIKRIMQEARELANDPCTDYTAAPLEAQGPEQTVHRATQEWHCTIRGTPGTEFEGGLYHFRILLPSEYPFRPPSIMMLTPNGRFELNTKICISFTNYHEELWQPAWGVRTAIIGLQGFFPLKGTAAVGVGALEYPTTERKRLAALSREWTCPHCKQTNLECLPDPQDSSAPSSDSTPSPASTPDCVAKPLTPVSEPTVPISFISEKDVPDDAIPSLPLPQAIEPPVKVYSPTPTRPIIPVSIVTPRAPGTPISRRSLSPGEKGSKKTSHRAGYSDLHTPRVGVCAHLSENPISRMS
ncbi:hypothetical protein NLI96_g6857 [Meripilus lineatus]|uniref:UBC core domain-containing protein n=1 Tax=Meripilus lineatus TaxID=2056292 RepID=A0AAD5V1Y2_9APHY|nr:hypothetical protein NLI96_g6857 [Physisporinus lineatus]